MEWICNKETDSQTSTHNVTALNSTVIVSLIYSAHMAFTLFMPNLCKNHNYIVFKKRHPFIFAIRLSNVDQF